MPRSLRIEFPGAFYHVMARGNRRETIFHDDDDRRFFFATLSEACAMTGWRVHAWVLMGNHYHLFIETPEQVAGLVGKDLPGLKGSDPRKLALAELLWKRTTVSQEWIAEKLSMRSAANVSQHLRRLDRVKTRSKLSPEMLTFLSEAWSSAT